MVCTCVAIILSLNSKTAATGSVCVLTKILLQPKLNCLLKFSAESGSSVQCVARDSCLIVVQLYFSAMQIPHSSEWLSLVIGCTSHLNHPSYLLKHWPSKTEHNNKFTSELCENNSSSPFSQQNSSALELLSMSGENGTIQHWTTYKITQLFELLAMFI